MSATQQAVTLVLPLPPASLSPNGRAHWRTKAKDAQRLRRDAFCEMRQAIWDAGDVGHPWPAATMRIHWFYAGIEPDSDNIVARLKSARDGIADACLVSNDRDIQIGSVVTVRVPRKDQRVMITLTRIEAT